MVDGILMKKIGIACSSFLNVEIGGGRDFFFPDIFPVVSYLDDNRGYDHENNFETDSNKNVITHIQFKRRFNEWEICQSQHSDDQRRPVRSQQPSFQC
jgi:hypothetical protein